jgi:two-component system KDP operon response regulator KdpE
LLDLNLPDMNGIDTCRIMRMVLPRIPILIITVSDSEDDKVGALDAGANDYITKPFHLRELVARIHSAMRWAQPIVPPEEEQVTVLRVGEIELDLVRRKMIKASRVVHLTPTEFSLTRELMSYAGQPISHSQLLKYVWGPDYEDERDYLRTYIHQLRKKIEDDPSNPKYLLTDVNFGYRFVEKL